jgi:hypothetical protein
MEKMRPETIPRMGGEEDKRTRLEGVKSTMIYI